MVPGSLVAALGLAQAWAVGIGRLIQPSYDRFAAAYVKNDVVGMLEVLSSDYVLVDALGERVTRAEYEQTLTMRNLNRVTVSAYTVTILGVIPAPGGVLVHTRETYADRARHTHEYADTWRHTACTWLLAETRTLKEN